MSDSKLEFRGTMEVDLLVEIWDVLDNWDSNDVAGTIGDLSQIQNLCII